MPITHATTATFQQEALEASVPVIVDFWAEWCGPCKLIAPILEEIAQERSDVKIVKVNVEESPDLASQHGVMSIPTLVVFKGGKKTNQIVGLQPKAQILAALAA